MLILIRPAVEDDYFIESTTVPPACVDCFHYKYESGSWCRRTITLKVFNVVTGKFDNYAVPTRCQHQRYGTHESCCGIEGKFFVKK